MLCLSEPAIIAYRIVSRFERTGNPATTLDAFILQGLHWPRREATDIDKRRLRRAVGCTFPPLASLSLLRRLAPLPPTP